MSTPFPPYPSAPEPSGYGPSDPNDLTRPLRGATIQQAAERFFKKYAVFNGRASRSEYWWWVLISFVVSLVLNLLGRAAGFFEIIDILWGLAIIVPGLALGARRLHDTGRSGWWQLLALIPCVGWIILIVWLATPPNASGQKYDL